MTHYLVVAHQTADSEELLQTVRRLAEENTVEVTLLVPATPVNHMAAWTEGEAIAVATERAERARMALEGCGARVVETKIGDGNPWRAIQDELLVADFDALIVSTFPLKKSRWLGMNLIEKVERAVDVPVTHVVAHSQE